MGDKKQPPPQPPVPQSSNLKQIWKYSLNGGITISNLSISANGECVAVRTSDDVVYLIDKTGRAYLYNKFNSAITSMAISPSGEYVTVGCPNWISFFNKSLARLWDRQLGVNDGAYSLSMSANGDFIAVGGCGETGGLYGRLHLFTQGGRELVSQRVGGQNAVVGSLSMSLDGQYIAFGTTSGKVHLINNKGKELWNRFVCTAPQLPPLIGYYCSFVATSGHGEWTVAGEDGGKLYLFDMKGKQLWDQNAGRNVRGVGISADGTVIAVTNAAGWLQIYNKEGKQLAFTQPGGQRCALSPDAAYVAVDNGAQEVQCWSTGLVYSSGTTLE